MNEIFTGVHSLTPDATTTALLADAWIKGVLMIAAAGVCAAGLQRASAATRYWVWLVALLALPCIPLLSMLMPQPAKPLWRLTAAPAGNELAIKVELAPTAQGPPAPGIAKRTRTKDVAAEATSHPVLVRHFERHTLDWLTILWIAGILVVFGRFLLGRWQIFRLHRTCDEVPVSLAIETAKLARSLGIARPVLVRYLGGAVPITWGSRRPVICVPEGIDAWSEEKRRCVLLHELAHVKRFDCLTHSVAYLICALFWLNPLCWLALRMLRIERERACDDLVLNHGCKPSDYAGHLIAVAQAVRTLAPAAAITMARPGRLAQRIAAIVDSSKSRRSLTASAAGVTVGAAVFFAAAMATQKPLFAGATLDSTTLRATQVAHLQEFARQKQRQAEAYAAASNDTVIAEFQKFFKAAVGGDGVSVTNMYNSFKARHPQYEHKDQLSEPQLHANYWSTVLEVCLAYFDVMAGEPKYVQMAVDDFLASIPSGSIYFGGTDPGRGLPTAFSRAHEKGDPFFTLTQNALADGTYLEYLRMMYGDRLSMLSQADSQRCYEQYRVDAERRMRQGQLKPGEDVKVVDGKVQVSGQVAVMAINGLLAKVIFDRNTNEFYIEESFPLDWMYPHLEPHGLVMKINRQTLSSLPAAAMEQDMTFWNQHTAQMLGPWLNEATPIRNIAQFVEDVYVKRDAAKWNTDPAFAQDWWAQRAFSKWRSSIGGLYAWRVNNAGSPEERKRMLAVADYAFRQAFALCPTSPEALYRYVNFLVAEHRLDDAVMIAETSLKLERANSVQGLLKQLNKMREQDRKATSPPKNAAIGADPTRDQLVIARQALAARTRDAEAVEKQLREAGKSVESLRLGFDAARALRDAELAAAKTRRERVIAQERYSVKATESFAEVKRKIETGQMPAAAEKIADLERTRAAVDLLEEKLKGD